MKNLIFLFLVLNVFDNVIGFSSFWAPLYNSSILNYRVDLKFDPEEAKTVREEFMKKNGYRAAKLIADLGNGRGPQGPVSLHNEVL